MAHFAKVLDGKVVNVIVAEPDFMTNDFVDTSPGVWIQCSYNTYAGKHWADDAKTIESDDQSKALRKNYPSIGYIYDSVRDAFYYPQPHASWTLNEDTCEWEAPIDKPTDAKYTWDEDAYQSDNTTGWVADSND